MPARARKKERIITAETLTSKERIDAICRQAGILGISYGKYVMTITDSEKDRAYEAYAIVLQERMRGGA